MRKKAFKKMAFGGYFDFPAWCGNKVNHVKCHAPQWDPSGMRPIHILGRVVILGALTDRAGW